MRKMYNPVKCLLVLLAFAAMKVGAQPLSGTVTINSGVATQTTTQPYNFQSFTAFATVLNANGVNGPLYVDVIANSGPYNEQPSFNQITGATAQNAITINGNNNLLTFNATLNTAPYTLWLNGTDFMTIQNLNIAGTNATYALVCILTNASNYNRFDNCTFTAPVNGAVTTHCPFAISGSNTSATTSGLGGEYNTVTSCTMANGYYGICSYGPTSAPYESGNSWINCRITDFYYYGMYFPYSKNYTLKNNTWDRLTRTTASTVYGWYGYNSQGLMADGNKWHKFFDAMPGASTTCYLVYNYGNPVPSSRNVYRNNIITDIKTNGTNYGFYIYNSGSDVYNNTLDFDFAAATTANTIYGMYAYGASGAENIITNNIITIRRGGVGTNRYGLYFALTGNVTVDRNNIHVNNTGGTNNIGYYGGAWATQAQWQSAGMDLTGFNVDPMYVSASDLHPTNPVINNQGIPYGLQFDQILAVRSSTAPDIGALEFLTPNCFGNPSGSLSGPAYSLCPGETAFFGVNNPSSDLGIIYQWNVSTSSIVGPFTVIPGATGLSYAAPNQTATTWYSVVMTCSLPGGGTVTLPAQVNIAGTTTNSVPYFEGFENIGMPGRLPNCSWSSPSIGSSAFTYTSAQTGNRLPRNGGSFGTFFNGITGLSYYYTNAIYMVPNITYSAAIWYQTDFSGATNWTDLSLLLGTAQTATAMTYTIASTNGPAVSPVYKLLSNTYTVSQPGYYYVGIRANGTNGSAQYLSIDDIAITIPCSLNSPTITIGANNSTVCAGAQVNLNATGATTYTWSTGATGANITAFPVTNPTFYSVTGTNSLTGCPSTANRLIYTKVVPVVVASAYPPVACDGQNVVLSASGAGAYTWNNNAVTPIVNVQLSSSTSFTVIGTNSANCTSSAVVNVQVNQNPTIFGSGPAQICSNESATLSATGASTYQWVGAGMLFQTNPVAVTPPVGQQSFTVTGTDVNGCSGTYVVNMYVDPCTGLREGVNGTARVYPNPAATELNIEVASGKINTLQVVDLTGRVVMNVKADDASAKLNVAGLAKGVYYVKVNTDIIKIIKE